MQSSSIRPRPPRARHRTRAAALAGAAALIWQVAPARAAGDPPTAFDAAYSTSTDQSVDVFLSASDPDGEPVTFAIETPPANGDLTDCTTGSCEYTPEPGFFGTDEFTFTASDGDLTSNVATITMDVAGSAMSVTSLADAAGAAALVAELIGEGITTSDVSFVGDPRGAGVFTGGTDGVGIEAGVVLSSGEAADVIGPNRSPSQTTGFDTAGDDDLTALAGVPTLDATVLEFDFVPDTDQLVFEYVFGSEEYNEFVNSSFNDVFAFFVNGVNCAEVGGDAVSINTINNGNPFGTEPNSNPDFFVNNEFGSELDTRDTELDGLTVVLQCVATVEANATNHIKLAIADGSDSSLDSAVFLARGSFRSNSAPTATPQSVSTPQDTALPIELTGSDPDGDALTFTVADAPTNGTLSGTGAELTYTPNAGFTGADSFTFVADDGALASPPATVSITVTTDESNQPPTADGQTVITDEDVAVGIVLTGSDPDGDPLTFTVVTPPSNGVLSGTASDLVYTPNPGYSGADAFEFVVDDGRATSTPATVTIEVVPAPVDQAPVVDAGQPASTDEGSPVTLGSGSATDPEGQPVSVVWTFEPGADVDAGATCSFSSPTALVTDVTCTDDGTYVVTLTGTDGTSDPVADTLELTVTNVAPTVSITAPADGSDVNIGSTVTVQATITDPGANDTHTCSVDWGDGSITAGTVAGGVCTADHVYSSLLVPSIAVVVTDDDLGEGRDEITVIVTSRSADVHGGGWIVGYDGARVSFGMVAQSTSSGPDGQVQVRMHQSGRFHGTEVTALTSTGNTATFSGEGRWNGEDGYHYEITVVDQGNGRSKKSSGPDTISIVIEDATGTVVYSVDGELRGGNLKVR